jgi:hypothetical protein
VWSFSGPSCEWRYWGRRWPWSAASFRSRLSSALLAADVVQLWSTRLARVVDGILEDALDAVKRRRDQLELLDELFVVLALP